MENLTRNIIAVTYIHNNQVAFCILAEYGKITNDIIKDYCYKFFSRLYGENIQVKIVPIFGNFTNIEVHTPDGLKILTWSWKNLYS